MKLCLQGCVGRHPAAAGRAAPALAGLSLEVASGEHIAVIGPSGAGKTTLLMLLACAMQPASGQVLLDGQDPWALGTAALQRLRGQLFLAPQVPPLPPRQRVVTAVLAAQLPHMSLASSLSSLFYPRDTALAHDALLRFDMADKLFERVDRLSGGERQRVGLARLAAAQARLLLVDEPLSALDPQRARQAVAAIRSVASEHQATLVATLHHVEMALQHFPRIIGLRQGELAFDLPAGQVTPARLEALYADQLHELNGPAPDAQAGESLAAQPPVAMHCR